MGTDKSVKKPDGITKFTKRSRFFIIIAGGAVVICFVALPLLFNDTTPPSPLVEQVHAAEPISEQQPVHATPVPVDVIGQDDEELEENSPILDGIEVNYPTLKLNDENIAVNTLQSRLMELGYFEYSEPTDFFGPVTKSAVQLFQRAYGLEQTGIADNHLQTLIYSEDAIPYFMSAGNKGTDIKSLQRRLNELGYYDEKDNGYFGVATEDAVKAFQKKNKIEETGSMGQDDIALLYSPKARYKVDPTPTPKPTPKATQKPTPTPKAVNTPVSDSSGTIVPGIPFLPEFPEDQSDTAQPSTPTPKPAVTTAPGSYGTGVNGFINAAQAQLGKTYILGDEGPDSFDCSGLVYYCLRQAGVNMGRYSSAAYSEYGNWDAIGSISECKPGDLIFYTSDGKSNVNHVAIYLGGGKIIHAATSAGRVLISDTTTGYYQRNFIIARRVF